MKFHTLANMLGARALSSITGASIDREWLRRKSIVMGFALIAMLAAGIPNGPALAEDPDITSRRASERTEFTNEEIKDGFFKIAFHAEMQIGAQAERVRKYRRAGQDIRGQQGRARPQPGDRRDRCRHSGPGEPSRRGDHERIARLPISSSRWSRSAIWRRPFARSTATTGRSAFRQSLSPQCLSGIGKDSRYRIRRAEVILPVDAGEFTFYDCAYEELLQALGAINDDRSVPWTMFNDDVQMGFFDVYDQYLLNILYDPRVRPGMTKKEVNALLPDVLSTTRGWVTNTRLPRHADAEHPQPQRD